MTKNYFPTMVATREAFCNRSVETERLIYNLETGTPSLLISPRRYGKTSLALQAFSKLELPYAHVDLYKALNEQEIAQYILHGIGKIISQTEKTPTKLLKAAGNFFGALQLNISLYGKDLSLEITQRPKRAVDLILTALEKLDHYVTEHSGISGCILFLDEFQTLAEVTPNKSIGSAIREAMQKSKSVRYVFAGSNRHLIERMFHDDSRSFFNACDEIQLNRISAKHYSEHIKQASLDRWGDMLKEDAYDIIFACTERHPYYINKLCSMILRLPKPATAEAIRQEWMDYVQENKARVEQEAMLLKLNQRRLLLHLASADYVENPFSHEYAQETSMPITSIHRAMNFLLEKDYVFKDQQARYRVLDPLIKAALTH